MMTRLLPFATAVFIALLLMIPSASFSQNILSGRVTDTETKEPLAFVSIVEKGTTNGCYTDIDGYYKIYPLAIPAIFEFSYIGYEAERWETHHQEDKIQDIKLHKMNNTTAEVLILPGVNPAERIIRSAIENKERNNPESDIAFTYDSYNKLVFGAALDSVLVNNPDSLAKRDSATIDMYNFLDNQYLFLMESIAKRKFLPPNHSEETIIANRVSGLKNTDFFLLTTQMQSFSFYGETVDILSTSYMSPLADGAIKKYLFIIEDTTFIENDTVFHISFRPRKGKNITGMKGQLFINTNGFALQNVIAEPNEADGLYIRIHQQYKFMNERKWFPVQLNSYFTFPQALVNATPITGEGKSYIKNLQLDVPMRRTDFTPVSLLLGKNAENQSDTLWNKYRDRPLDLKEAKTYQVVDSVGKAENFDRKLLLLESLASGLVPMGPLSFELARLLRYNAYEGYRLGAGFRTNNKLSNKFSLGAYYAYGFKDKHSKYGGDTKIHLYKKRNAWLKLLVEKDVMEAGGNQFVKPNEGFLTQGLYPFFVSRMDKREKAEVQLNGRVIGNLSATVFGNSQFVETFSGYQFTATATEDVLLYLSQFKLFETGITLRFAPGEKLVRTRTREISLGGYYPVFWMRATKGWNNILNGDIDYLRYDAMIEKTFRILNVGDFAITTVAGFVPNDVPLSLLYNAKGTNTLDYKKKWVGIASPGSFETMATNEFMHSEYVAVHLRHNFKDLLLKKKKFRPKFILVQNMLWGRMQHPTSHNISTKAASKGFYESGLQVDNLLKTGFTSLGFGIFYRYGPEHLKETINNFAFKLTSSFNF